MPKHPNSKSKQVKRDEPMTGAMKFFLAGCVAELYLLIVRRFYINGTMDQMIQKRRTISRYISATQPARKNFMAPVIGSSRLTGLLLGFFGIYTDLQGFFKKMESGKGNAADIPC